MSKKSPTKSHQQMVAEWKKDPEFVAANDELETEFTLLRELLQVRQRAGLTQADVAEKMGTRRQPLPGSKRLFRTTGIRPALPP